MDNQLYQVLLIEIRKKFAKSSEMVNALADILRIEKGAVYRRLRHEVPFTFNEIALIAKELMISLDSMVGIVKQNIVPFQSLLPDFISPQEDDIQMLDYYIKFLQSINRSENSETATVVNLLPHELFSEFRHLFLFYLFEWNFLHNNNKVIPYNQISTLPEVYHYLDVYAMEMKKFKKTSFIFDSRIFQFFVNDINYVYSIRLIEKEDILKIKDDLLSLLDYLEAIAISGQFKETGNAVNLYISDIDIATNYACMESESIHFCMVKMFLLSSVSSMDENTFEKMKRWIQSLIKISTLITLTNELQRVLYFEKQREIVNGLII